MISSRSRLLVVATGVTLLVAASGCGADLAAVGSPSADRAASIDAGSGRDREVATSPDVKGSADAAANEDGSGSVRAASRSRETTSTVAKAISPASGVPRSGRAPAPPTPPPTLYTSNDGRPDESGTGSAPICAGAPASK